jgi:hypothetical protein
MEIPLDFPCVLKKSAPQQEQSRGMPLMIRNAASLFTAVSLAALATPASADEGMWTFDNFPTNQVREKYGWAPDQTWLNKVQAAAVRLTGGCSASFVSPQGLILTNQHCIATCLFDNSNAERDYLANGSSPAAPKKS